MDTDPHKVKVEVMKDIPFSYARSFDMAEKEMAWALINFLEEEGYLQYHFTHNERTGSTILKMNIDIWKEAPGNDKIREFGDIWVGSSNQRHEKSDELVVKE